MKYVLVTGASGGMGKAVTALLAQKGYFVFALDRVRPAEGERIVPIEADVTDEKSVQMAQEEVLRITPRLDAVLHFAGIYVLDSLVEMSEDKFCRAFEVNVFGVYRINRIFLPLLGQGSRILITTSELAPLAPLPFTGLYAVTKSALDKYAYSLRMEVGLLGISVAVLRPGAVKTDMLGVSTRELDRFVDGTQLYSCNARRFKCVVDRVEARCVSPERVAKKAERILSARRMRYVYKINRNPLLLFLNALPARWQTGIIQRILK